MLCYEDKSMECSLGFIDYAHCLLQIITQPHEEFFKGPSHLEFFMNWSGPTLPQTAGSILYIIYKAPTAVNFFIHKMMNRKV